MGLITLAKGTLVAKIFDGSRGRIPNQLELVSLVRGGEEFMHGGGLPEELKCTDDRHPDAWDRSELTMCPVGGAKDGAYLCQGSQDRKPMAYAIGKHGLPRHMAWTEVGRGSDWITTRMRYSNVPTRENGTVIHNTKENPKDEASSFMWPFSFSIEREIRLIKDALRVTYNVENLEHPDENNPKRVEQPYTLGWHPAFKLGRDAQANIFTPDLQITLDDIKASPGNVYKLPNTNRVMFQSERRAVSVISNMGHMQLWRKGNAPHICMEPVTIINPSEGYTSLHPPHGKILQPGETAQYIVSVTVGRPSEVQL